MASRTSKRKRFAPDLKNLKLNLEDVTCPICLCILVEPVTLPCKHELCMPCFKKNVQETSLQCPICRRRIATWSRKAARENSLVNQERWGLIRRSFPEKIQRRLKGEDNLEDSSDDDLGKSRFQKLCEPGEIRKEYEVQLKQMQDLEAREREDEIRRSEALIKTIQEKEREEVEKQKKEALQRAEKDRMIALVLSQKLNEVQGSSAEDNVIVDSVLEKINTVLRPASCSDTVGTAATRSDVNGQRALSCNVNLRRQTACSSSLTKEFATRTGDHALPSSSSQLVSNKGSCFLAQRAKLMADNEMSAAGKSAGKLSRSGSMESIDSISPELCHFRPIKSAPKTPPLRLPDGRVIEPKLIHATPRNLSLQLNAPCGSQGLAVPTQAVLKKRLLKVEDDRRNKAGALLRRSVVTKSPIPRQLKLKQSLPLKQSGKPLTLVSSSPGNCSYTHGQKPPGAKPSHTGPVSGFKFASSYLAANKENPKVTAPIVKRLCPRKRKVENDLGSSKHLATDGESSNGNQKRLKLTPEAELSRTDVGHVSHNDIPNKFGHGYHQNGTTVTSQLGQVICNLTGTGHTCVKRSPKREPRGSARAVAEEKKVTTRLSVQRQQEAADYTLALKLQQEWNRDFYRRRITVDRRHGTSGEYNLRRRQASAIC